MGWQETVKEKAKKAFEDYKFNQSIQQMKQSRLKRAYDEEFEKAQATELRKKARRDATQRYAPKKAVSQESNMFSVAFGSPASSPKIKSGKRQQKQGNVFNEVFGR
jgi:membrane-associated HD superfamily phosphohydrolase